MNKLEFANDLASKNLKHYQNKINEIVDWINEHEKNPPYIKPPVYG